MWSFPLCQKHLDISSEHSSTQNSWFVLPWTNVSTWLLSLSPMRLVGVCCKNKVSPWRFAHSSLFLQLNLSRRKQDVWDFPSAGRYLKLQETPLKISLTFYSQAKDSHSEISFPESLKEMTFKDLGSPWHCSIRRCSQHIVTFDSESQGTTRIIEKYRKLPVHILVLPEAVGHNSKLFNWM